ncbi:MAG: hypothetical protein WCD18_12295 [Thermosynechococcaceae cyanobacterium]
MSDDDFRPVNQLLGASPNLGPIPANQVVPWLIILMLGLALGSFFAVPWQWCIAFIIWGIATYWLLTGNHPWRFLARFRSTPSWVRGHPFYTSPLEGVLLDKQGNLRKSRTSRKSRLSRKAKGQLLARSDRPRR